MAGRGMDATTRNDQVDLRAKADRIATIAETRVTIARLSQRRAESIQLAHSLRSAIGSIEGADAASSRARDLALKLVAAHIMLGNLLAGESSEFDETGVEAEFRAAIHCSETPRYRNRNVRKTALGLHTNPLGKSLLFPE